MWKLLTWVARIVFVAVITCLAWFNISASVMAVCAVVLVAISSKLESLVEFSFGPLKAKIERNLSESEKLLSDLKGFASIQARAANAACVWTGRFASGDDWIFQSVKRVERGLKDLGATEDQLIEARSDFVQLTIRDAAIAATGGNRVPALGGSSDDEWRNLRGAHRVDPDRVQEFLSRWGKLEPERLLRIEDMRWMIANRDVRDAEQYMRAHTPVPWKEGQA